MASKIRRWLRELAVWLLIGAAVSLAVDYFRQPALPQKRQRHIAADTRRQDAGSERHKPAKAAAAVRLGDLVRSLSLYHAVGGIACRRRRQCADGSPAFRR
ncbi:Membrane protein, suppressor for copper-sensitivity ScsD [Klebsiella pneumoniae IS53]|nr:Membrane protein, suppressor for copper-sensitivity ScsD [Klebsiella pneumoniae IS53]